MTLLFVTLLALQSGPSIDLSDFDPSCGIKIEASPGEVRVEWPAGAGSTRSATFHLDPSKPLIASLEADGKLLARNVRPLYIVSTGARVRRPGERYIFFDKPADQKNGPVKTQEAEFAMKSVRAMSSGKRVRLTLGSLRAGVFSGELHVLIYSGSPFLHFEAALGLEVEQVAYIYDFVLEGDWKSVAWKDNVTDQWVRVAPDGIPKPVGVRHRAIFAESGAGSVGVFPAPHAFFYPHDWTTNFKTAQVGKGRFGLRQDVAGGPGHQGAYIPWIDAPAGRIQRLAAFVWLDAEAPETALERLLRYTHGDAFKPVEGRTTFTSHWHLKLTMNDLAGKPAAREAAAIFKAMNVNVVHLAEFHGDGHPADPGPQRLPELRHMFEVCRRHSDDRLLFIPGEEANAQLNTPAPPGIPAGHWLYLFPRPVYLTLVRGPNVPLAEEIDPYGTVYHAGSEADMVEILRREKALAWTAHPRIKASYSCPDSYREKDWYRDELWLGAAWKAMPADLSENRLGVRGLDLLDDMNIWGQPKQLLGEVDTFELDRTHELYAHLNINYLRLRERPTSDDWAPVLRVLRDGDFFTTTGEVLIHSFEVKAGKVVADLEWTFPLSQAELVTGLGGQVKRRTIPLAFTGEFGRATFEWALEPADAATVRLEAWDVTSSGAFTQPLRLR
jgi:hypothetical protein